MKTGLVLGKFAPLHKGHQLLIETALEGEELTDAERRVITSNGASLKG